MIAGAGRSDFGFAKFAMADGEIAFEVFPGFVSGGLSFPDFGVVDEHASSIDELVGGRDDLCWGVGRESGGRKIDWVSIGRLGS